MQKEYNGELVKSVHQEHCLFPEIGPQMKKGFPTPAKSHSVSN